MKKIPQKINLYKRTIWINFSTIFTRKTIFMNKSWMACRHFISYTHS